MQRYFSNNKDNNYLTLNNDDIYHIKKVMRMNINDLIEVVYEEKVYLCQILNLEPCQIAIIKELKEDNELALKVTLVQSMVNEQKMDYILQKCTELGVHKIYGYKATNSVIKDNGKNDKKVMRWQKITKEAAEQSKRNIIPQVVDIIDIKGLAKIDADIKLLLSVNEKVNNVKKVLQDAKRCDTMIIVVGPEGGFAKEEETFLMQNGYQLVSLGNRVLRTETAGVATLAMINYEWMV